jgi:hypothetical protein
MKWFPSRDAKMAGSCDAGVSEEKQDAILLEK